jgi:hypothetical protein
MGVYPSTGHVIVGSDFTVTLQVDGGGQLFNAVGATVTVSGPATVHSLSLACGGAPFIYLGLPTASNPSFGGALLAATTSGCTLYTLDLHVTDTGPITIDLTNAQVLMPPAGDNILAPAGVIDGSYTAIPPIPGTTFVASGSVDPNTGGDISGLLPTGESILVSFPPGAVTTTVTVLIQAFTTPPQSPPDGDTVVGMDFDLSAIDGSGNLISHFNAPVTLTFGYLAGRDPTLMTLAYYDTTQGAWAPLVTSIDTTNQQITATTDHFTTFSVVGLPSPAYCTDALHTDAFLGTGDINASGHIDLVDFSIFAGDYGKTTSDPSLFSPYSDMNCDGQVDFTDFSVFATYYGR